MRFFSLPTYSSTPGGTESIPSTDSNQTDRRFTLSGLAKWIIENYTGSTVGGAAQSVKAALTKTAKTIAAADIGTNVTLNRAKVYTIGKTCYVSISISVGTGGVVGTDALISNLPNGSVNYQDVVFASGSGNAYIGLITSGGVLRFGGNATVNYPAGTYAANFIYETT